jgi:hypothetical protein
VTLIRGSFETVSKCRAPQEKKRLAYERDHYVSAGESRHAFRKNWPKKKARLNRKHRHRVTRLLDQLEKLGDFEAILGAKDLTAEQIRKHHRHQKLSKAGVRSLAEYVKRNRQSREDGIGRDKAKKENLRLHYSKLIHELEREPSSPRSKEFLMELARGGWDLRRFLLLSPEWKPRVIRLIAELKRRQTAIQLKQETREIEKQRERERNKPRKLDS